MEHQVSHRLALDANTFSPNYFHTVKISAVALIKMVSRVAWAPLTSGDPRKIRWTV